MSFTDSRFALILIGCALGACTKTAVQDTANNLDPVFPKIVDIDAPTGNVSSPTVNLGATFVPGLWLDDDPPAEKHFFWARSIQKLNSRDNESQLSCQPAPAAGDGAEHCSVEMHPSATGTYYFQWVYESPNSQDTIDKPDPYGSFYAVVVNSDPPPPEDPEITKFEISNPICDDDEDTEATVSVAFDEKDYPVETSNSPVCIFLVLDGNVNGTEDDGGGALACWSLPSAQSGGNYFTWDDPTKFSKDLDIDGHYGGPGSMPDEIAFKLLLTDDSHNYNVLDQMQKTIPVEACN